MQRNMKTEGGSLARMAWRLSEILIALIAVTVEAVSWLYHFLASLPVSRICCLTTGLTCFIFILNCYNPYLNTLLFLLLAQSMIGFAGPDESAPQRRARHRGRRDRRI